MKGIVTRLEDFCKENDYQLNPIDVVDCSGTYEISINPKYDLLKVIITMIHIESQSRKVDRIICSLSSPIKEFNHVANDSYYLNLNSDNFEVELESFINYINNRLCDYDLFVTDDLPSVLSEDEYGEYNFNVVKNNLNIISYIKLIRDNKFTNNVACIYPIFNYHNKKMYIGVKCIGDDNESLFDCNCEDGDDIIDLLSIILS